MKEAEFPPLLDVTDVPLVVLRLADHPALQRSLRRLLDSLNDPHGVISAFGSAIAED